MLKKVLFWGAIVIIVILALIHIIHGLIVDRKVTFVEKNFTSPKVSPELEGYTIGFLTDFHRVSPETLEKIVKNAQNRKVDLLLLGGDFSRTSEKTEHDLSLLATIPTTDGIYGVEGNHDFKNQLFQRMRSHEMVPLENTGHHIRSNLFLGGVEDYRIGTPSVRRALKGAKDSDLKILLTHNPDVSMLPDNELADLFLAGHTHGGEVRFFGLWSPFLPFVSHHGWRFQGGWSTSKAGIPVYVSNGIGRHSPLRSYCPPQVIYLTLTAGEE